MWFIAVDDLFREANIEPNGKVKYDEFIQKIAIPVPDYWMEKMQERAPPGPENQTDEFLQRKAFLSL